MMKKTSVIALILSILSWIIFFAVPHHWKTNSFNNYLVVLPTFSFVLGALSFYKINNKLSIFLSIIAMLLSTILALLLIGVILIGKVIKIS